MAFAEPLRTTLLRNGTLALALGTVVFVASAHRIGWYVAVLTALWPTLGGHWVEVWFLNWLSPRIAPDRLVQGIARLVTWMIGGVAIAVLMLATVRILGGPLVAWRWAWLGGVAFIAIELVVHGASAARAQPSASHGR